MSIGGFNLSALLAGVDKVFHAEFEEAVPAKPCREAAENISPPWVASRLDDVSNPSTQRQEDYCERPLGPLALKRILEGAEADIEFLGQHKGANKKWEGNGESNLYGYLPVNEHVECARKDEEGA